MKYYVKADECIGCGLCVSSCPQVFSMNNDGISVAISTEVPEELLEYADEAKANCPVETIETR